MASIPCCLPRPASLSLFNFTTSKHIPTLGLGITFALLASLTIPIFSILLGEIFNSFTIFGDGETSGQILTQKVSTYCLQLVCLGIAGWVCNGLCFILFVIFGELQVTTARDRLFKGLLRKDQQWFETQQDGARAFLSSLQTQFHELQVGASQPLGLVLHYSFRVIASLGLAFYTSWELSLVTLAGIPIFSTIISLLSKRVRIRIEEQQVELKNASRIVNNAVASINTVKYHNAQNFELENFVTSIDKAASKYLGQAFFNSIQISVSRFMTFGMFVQGFWYGSTLVTSGRLSSGDVLRTFWACSAAAQSVELLLPQLTALEKGKAAASAFQKILNDQANETPTKDMQGASYPRHCEGDIEVSNVSFSYASQPNRLVLDSSSFFFPAGSTTFVIGESGSGKSTLGQLLGRFYLPTSGEILIDGIPLQTLSTSWIRNNITLVEQRSILFNESVLKNIAFGSHDHKEIRKDDIQKCIELAMLQKTIENLPNGIDTCVGDGGNFLSGGQRQRVAIARARLRDTPILILDEPTSALDGENSNAVMDAIREWRKGKTTIIITHDMSYLKDDDFVYVMNKGSITQAGCNHELKIYHMERVFCKGDINSLVSSQISEAEYDKEITQSDNMSSDTSSTAPMDDGYVEATRIQCKHNSPKPQEVPVPYFSGTSAHTEGRSMCASPDFSNHKRLGITACTFKGSTVTSSFGIPMSELYPARLKSSQGMDRLGRDDAVPSPEHWMKGSLNLDHLLEGQKISLSQALQTIIPCLTAKQRFLLFLGCLCALGHSAATPLFSYFLSRLLENFYNKGSSGMKWALAVLGVAVCDALISFSMHYSLEWCGQAWVDRVRKRGFQRVLEQDQKWFLEAVNSPMHLSACFNESGEEMRSLLGRFGGFALIAIAVTLLAIIWSLALCWSLTLVALACGPIIYAIMRGFEKMSGLWDRRCNAARTAVSDIFVETFAEIRTVRTLTLESYFHKKFLKAASRCLTMGLRKSAYTGLLFGLAECTVIFFSALIFYYGATLVSYGESTIQSVLTVFSVLLFSIGYAGSVVACIPQISTSREMASQLLRVAGLRKHASHEYLGNLIISEAAPLKISGLNFRYPSRPDTMVLKNVSINIPEGSCVALVGASGSGKSTIAALLLSLYETPPSTIFLGGIDIRNLYKPSLRSLISIVPQQPSIFPGTVYANITYGLEHGSHLSSLHNVRAATKAAVIDEFIESLPDGYFTLIGDGGVGLSGGQMQRLIIARALARQPRILILDEATSGLDPNNARKVKETVRKLVTLRHRMTILIITHAAEMMEIADNIIVLEQGCVVEKGSYKKLLRKPGGRLAELVKNQTTGVPDG